MSLLPTRRVDAETASISSAASAYRSSQQPSHSRRGSVAARSTGGDGGGSGGGASGSASPRAGGPSGASDGTASSYRVYVRIRPFLPTEMDPSDRSFPLPPIELRGTRECLFIDQTTGIPRDVFHFDGCFCSITQHQWAHMSDLIALPVESLPTFPPCASQEDLFEAVGKPMVDSVMDGFNASILAYGQTSSGKTFTMMGTPQNEGLIPRIARSIMEEAERRTIVAGEPSPLSSGAAAGNAGDVLLNGSFSSVAAAPLQRSTTGLMGSSTATSGGGTETILSRDFSMELSFFEIYNEAVLDLLQTGSTQHRRRKVRVHPAMGVYVEGLTYEKVSSWSQCLRFLTRGLQQRHTAATKMNEVSSRSHAIFQLRLVQTDMTDIGPVQHRSNVYLADLAGSERIKLSAVEGDRLKESAQINLSLTTLRRVIDALIQAGPPPSSSGAGGGPNNGGSGGASAALSGSGTAGKMVPYRESMLTWVLSESLGGNAKACMVATLCPHPTYVEETFQTLQYAHRAKSIVNSVVKNEDQMAKMLRQLQDALAATARGGAPMAASVVEGVDPTLHFQLEDRVKQQDLLIRKLREEQMLMLTKYADLKDVYESLKDDHAREVDLHEEAQKRTKVLHDKYDALRQQLNALKTRNETLEAADEMRSLDAQRAAMECERLEHWKTQADLSARRTEQDLAQANEERLRLRGEVDALTAKVERATAKHQAELHQSKLAHDRDLSACRHLQHWYDRFLDAMWEGCFSTRRVNAQLNLSSWACEWASACHARSAALSKRVDVLQTQLHDLEFVNTAQDKSLTQVAAAYVDVREFLHCIESRSSGGGGGSASTGRTQSAEANWTVAGILQALHRFCNSARQCTAVSVRAAAASGGGNYGGTRSQSPPGGNAASPMIRSDHNRSKRLSARASGGKPPTDTAMASPSPMRHTQTPWKHPPMEGISPMAKPPRRAPLSR